MEGTAAEVSERCHRAVVEELVDLCPGDADAPEPVIAALAGSWLRRQQVEPGLRDTVVAAVIAEIRGVGPLTELLADPAVSEIMVNAADDIWVEREGHLSRTGVAFRDLAHLRLILDRLLAQSGRRIDSSRPLVDSRLRDGSRITAALPPAASGGPLLSIRRFRQNWPQLEELLATGAISAGAAAFLHAMVTARANMLMVGAAGSGKTTLLAAVAALAPQTERLVAIEDVAELRIRHAHFVGLQCAPSPASGDSGVTLRDLVRASLRLRPDRLIVGEVRGVEVVDLVAALNTGHTGSMATIHSRNAGDAIDRLQEMMALGWEAIDAHTLQRWLGRALDVIVECRRLPSGARVVAEIATVEWRAGEIVAVPIFSRRGRDLQPTGAVPTGYLRRLEDAGMQFPLAVFECAA